MTTPSIFRRQHTAADRYDSRFQFSLNDAIGSIVREFFEQDVPLVPIAAATRALSGYWPNAYAGGGAPDVGVASAGTSLGNDLTAAATGWSNGTAGTGLNGIASHAFNGVTTGREADDTLATMLGERSWSYACLVKTTSLAAHVSTYEDPPLWHDENDILGITVSDAGIVAFIYDVGAVICETPAIPFPNGTWVWVQARWDGSRLYLRLNNGKWSTVPCASIHSVAGPALRFGNGPHGKFHGEKLVEMFSKECWAPQIFNGLGLSLEPIYDIRLGFSSPNDIAWTGIWEAPYAGNPWTPEGSAGTSTENGVMDGGAFPPAVGVPAPPTSAYDSADFNGAFHKLASAYELDKFFTNTRISIHGVVAANSTAPRNVGNGYLDAQLVCQDVNGLLWLTFTDDGICFGFYDGASFSSEVVVACPADGLPHTYHAWYDGMTLNLIVDGVAATPLVCAPFFGATSGGMVGYGVLKIGENYDLSAYFDGLIWSTRTANIDIGDEGRATLEAFYQARYFAAAPVGYTRNISENVVKVSDANTRQGVFVRSHAHNVVKVNDANTRQAARLRTILENILKPTDANTRSVTNTRLHAHNVVKVNDANARALTLARGQNENVVKVSDANTRMQGLTRNIVENVPAPSDVNARITGRSRNINENVAIPTDANARALALARTKIETVAIPTDANARVLAATRLMNENVVKVADAVARSIGVTRNIVENVPAPSDTNARSLGFTRTQLENVVKPTDVVARALTLARGQNENVVKVSDAIARAIALTRTMLESILKPTDANVRSQGVTRAMSESIAAPTDSVVRTALVSRTKIETLSAPTDAVIRLFVGTRNMSESIPLPVDVVSYVINSGTVNYPRNISESVGAPTDVVSRSFAGIRAMLESILKPADANTRALGVTRAQAESIAKVDDANARSSTATRVHAENVLKPSDANTRAVGITKVIFENVPAPTDVNSSFRGVSRFMAEFLAPPTDIVVRSAIFSREMVEIIPIPVAVFVSVTVAMNAPASLEIRDAPFAQLIGVVQPFAQLAVTSNRFVTLAFTFDAFASVDFVTIAPFAETTIIMNQDKYDVGDTAEIVAEIRVTRTKVLTNPTALTIRVTPPDGVPVVYTYPCPEIVNDATGKFRALIDCTQPGPWEVYWVGTGPAKFARKMYFQVV